MGLLFRRICLFCFSNLIAAIMIFAFEEVLIATGSLTSFLNAIGCQANPEIIPNISCGYHAFSRPLELVLNLPLLFIYAVSFVILIARADLFVTDWAVNAARQHEEWLLLLLGFLTIFILALIYPVLLFMSRASRPSNR